MEEGLLRVLTSLLRLRVPAKGKLATRVWLSGLWGFARRRLGLFKLEQNSELTLGQLIG